MVPLPPKLVHGRVAPTPARQREQRRARRHTVFLVFAIALAALILAAVAAPEARAQTTWDGAVEVSTVRDSMSMSWGRSLTLNIEQGGSASYYLRLSEAPEEDNWYVRIFVEKRHIHDGVYTHPGDTGGVSWQPPIGYGFDKTGFHKNGRHVSITVDANARVGRTYVFEHEVWGTDGECPVHPDDPAHADRVGRVTVNVVGAGDTTTDTTTDTTDDNGEGGENNDIVGDPSLPTLTIADAAAVVEGETARFTLTLSPASEQTVTVGYQTHQGSAHTSLDFVGTSGEAGTLTFTAGVTEQFIDVQTSEDTTDEPEENFTVALSDPTNATLADDPEIGVGRIVDDDPLPTLSIDDVSVDEGDPASFTVTLTARAHGTSRWPTRRSAGRRPRAPTTGASPAR